MSDSFVHRLAFVLLVLACGATVTAVLVSWLHGSAAAALAWNLAAAVLWLHVVVARLERRTAP